MRRIIALALLVGSACERSPYREVDVERAPTGPAQVEPDREARRELRFSVAAIESARDTYAGYSRLVRHLGERLAMPVTFVQRRTYREVNDLLASGQLDAALLCTGGYLDLQRKAPGAFEIIAVPVVDGVQTYETLVVVPATSPARTVADLVGKRFAYTDELSFSGHAYVRKLLRDMGQDPDRFFGSVLFTRSHDRSIAAVDRGLADGATIHGGIWNQALRDDPALARRVRVLHRSRPFGAMPVVVSKSMPPETRARLKRELLDVGRDAAGEADLRAIGVERFAEPAPGLFEDAARVVEEPR